MAKTGSSSTKDNCDYLANILRIYKDGAKNGDSTEAVKAAFLISCGVNKLTALANGTARLFEDHMLIIANRNSGVTLEISCSPFANLQVHPQLQKCVKHYLRTVVMSWGHFYKGVGSTSFYANPADPIIGAIYKRSVLNWAQKHINWSPEEFPNKLCDIIRRQGKGEFRYDYRVGLDPYTTYGWAMATDSCEDAAYTVIDDKFENAINEARSITSSTYPEFGKKNNQPAVIVT